MTDHEYPTQITLADAGEVELRVMTKKDKKPLLAFARSLPPDDLLFLRVDLTEEKVVDDWIANLDSGNSRSLVAYDAKGLVGYATVHSNATSWTRHMGEIRVNVSPEFRGCGLGRVLISHIFDLAGAHGLQKLTAHMTADQRGAQAAFRKLGFVPEAHLADYVQDRSGATRDMIIMSFDLAGHTDQVLGRVQI